MGNTTRAFIIIGGIVVGFIAGAIFGFAVADGDSDIFAAFAIGGGVIGLGVGAFLAGRTRI